MLRRGKKKTHIATLENIGPALVPTAVFTAVPNSPPPKAPSGTPLGLASALFGSSFLSRAIAEPTQAFGDDPLSDPESSLNDYGQLEEAGYSTVNFRTRPNQNRKSYSDRERVPTPTFERRAVNEDGVSPPQPGGMYFILEPDSADVEEAKDLYAVPLRKKYRNTNKSQQNSDFQSDEASLDRTQQAVNQAMQEVHDLQDETMLKTPMKQVLGSHPGSSSGIETMIGGEFEIDSNEMDGPPSALKTGVHFSLEPHDEAKEDAYVFLREQQESKEASRARSEASRAGLKSSHISHSTPVHVEVEIEQLKDENKQLQTEVINYKRVVEALRVGDNEGADTVLRNHYVQEMKKENEFLKNSVQRLSSELSKYQSKYRPLSSEESSQSQCLPADGPIPSWLINRRYLAPLFLAYDDLIKEKEEALERHLKEMKELKVRTEEVLRENQKLRLQGGAGQLSTSEWKQLHEQARLVLEENQILIEQLNVQENKITDLCFSHAQEVNRLMKRQTHLETEKQESEVELEKLKHKFKQIKQEHDQLLLNSNNHMTMQDHLIIISDLKKSIHDEKEQLEKEKETFTNKLKASEDERRKHTMAAIELGAENKQLKAEIKTLHKVIRKTQNKILILQKAVEQSENKELIIQNELANVIRIVEKTALERDTAFKVVKEQQQDCKETINHMLGTNVAKGKLEERLKMYKLKASAKLQTVAEKLKEQDNAFNRQRQEYEREIRYLQLLVKEKEDIIRSMEGVKKELEEDLEVMWQAASSENQRLKDVLRISVSKLKEHTSLKAVLEDEEKLETLVCFSDQDG